MIGIADDKKKVDVPLITFLTKYLKNNGYGGVMTWALNRDQSGNDIASSTGLSGLPPKVFTNAIIGALKGRKRILSKNRQKKMKK